MKKLFKPGAYDHKKIEPKWQKVWERTKAFKATENSKKKKFYGLIEFPYPSGEGLHVGHIRSNTAMDIISRKRRREGYEVLYPIGWDAFGLPTENYAIKTGKDPHVVTKANTDTFRRQLKALGFSFDWSREIDTTDPKYYKWTQWIFLKFLENGLAYKKKMSINWCPKDLIGLANEEVVNGRCERCGTPVEKREKEQWMLAITKYAERLLGDLDAWDESTLPHIIDKAWPPRPGKKVVKRRNVHALVRDPKTGKYLALKWKKFDWTTFVIGGVETGEDIVEAAQREVIEETGYHDLKLIKVLGGPVKAEYFAAHKDQNRVAITSGVLFELASDAKKDQARESHEDFDVTWTDISDIAPCAELPVWIDRLNARIEYDPKNPHIPCFVDTSPTSAVREGLPFAERNAIAAVVKHWKEDKYIGLKWKKVSWQTLITGGPEEGQTAEEATLREITEETGYLNPKLVRKLGNLDAKFFHNPKNVNRFGHFDVFYIELKNGDRRELTAEESANHEVVWLTKEQMSDFISPSAQKYIWNTLFLKKPDKHFDEAKPLLDWIPAIKEQQRNWIGRSEGAEIDFRLDIKTRKTRFVLIHGYKGSPQMGFFPWLKSELEKRGHEVEAPELPNPLDPKESEQVEHVLKNCHLDENTVVIGHSLGSVVALKALMKLNKPISGLVLTAAAFDPRFPGLTKHRSYWKSFSWDFDFDRIKKLTSGKIAVLSDTREPDRVPYLKGLAANLNAFLVEAESETKHFNGNIEPELLKNVTANVTVFTTRPDTLFGVTYLVLAPEHPWVGEMKQYASNNAEIDAYIDQAKRTSEMVRTDATKEKTGVELKGIVAISPATGEELPVWIADYVLPDYGTGAVMAVPAHDERDFEFAKKYKLPIKQVIVPYIENTTDLIPKKDAKTVRRPIVHAVIKHPTENKYLFIAWKDHKWNSMVTGGIEAGENILEAARREIHEETGYRNLKELPDLSNRFEVHSYFYAPHKGENRYMIARTAAFQLENLEKDEVSAEEASKHDLVWIDADKAEGFLTHRNQKMNWAHAMKDQPYASAGVLISSDGFDGQSSESAQKAIVQKFGRTKVTFKLRDWVFSRQRYWGEPIPVVHCESCGTVPVPVKQLPVKLPKVKNYQPTQTGESPLAAISSWVNAKCPKCKGKAKRETDTMPQWAGSSWYYLRFADSENSKAFAGKKNLDYWMPVDWYNGGMEHTTLHLLYSRFWHKFLFDIGEVPTPEPYAKRTSHGLILAEGGVKMSKSKGNVVNPDVFVEAVGADSLRLYEMFMGPFDQPIAWDSGNIAGARRFIERVWKLREKVSGSASTELTPFTHRLIKKVNDDIESMKFNTAISSMMIGSNELEKMPVVSRADYEAVLKLLAPFAPHVTEELWAMLGNMASIHASSWPKHDPTLAAESESKIIVQVNGKMRGSFMAASGVSNEELERTARSVPDVAKWLEKGTVKKVIVVPGKLVSIVISEE